MSIFYSHSECYDDHMPTLFLTGYERETVEEFIEKIKKAKVDLIIDVREIPLSRKNGFSKNNLIKILNDNEISYLHFPELGSPSNIRKELHEDKDYLKFFTKYRKYAKRNIGSIHDVLNSIEDKKHPAIMCFEQSCELCHRSILASEILKIRPSLQIIPL